ncbi:MAG: hypothetical protein H5U40_15000, partial [Polyangiaceae bacterium]|nr:hypothetical protein [Polyangiaceae bacterium]
MRVLALLVLGALASGCAPDMTSSSLLVRSRALAARVTVDTDETRANPRPGESATVEVFVADPGAKVARTWWLRVCEPAPTSFGMPICRSLDYIADELNTTVDATLPFDAPSIGFTVPSESALAEGTDELLMLGAICSGGVVDQAGVVAYFGALAAGTAKGPPPVCAGGVGEGEVVTLHLPLELGQGSNHQPTIAMIRRNGGLFT